jgi:hypothetical protein
VAVIPGRAALALTPWGAFRNGQVKLTGQNLGQVFSSKSGRAFLGHAVALITKTAQIKVQNSAQTTFRLSAISFWTPLFSPG